MNWEELNPYKTVIFANGEMPVHEIALQQLRNAETIICCDGAVTKLLKLGFEPAVIVGDGDSTPPEILAKYANIFIQDKDVNYNDFNKAFRYALKNGLNKIAVIGAFGLREDHALANLSIALMFAEEEHLDIVMISNSGIFTPIFQTTVFQSFQEQQVSIFSFHPDTCFTFSNLKYPVERRTFRHFWEGSLNEALTDNFTIYLEKGRGLVFREFQVI